MPNYHRAFRPGGTFFLTLVTERRAPIFADPRARFFLHNAFTQCLRLHPFTRDEKGDEHIYASVGLLGQTVNS